MITLTKILVPTDFSECSETAVRYGFELAHTFDATLHLLHVVEDPNTSPWAAQGFPLSLTDGLEHFQDESRRRLLDSVPPADIGRVVVSCPIASPVAEILRYAEHESIESDRRGDAWPGPRRACPDRQRGGARRPAGAVPRAHGQAVAALLSGCLHAVGGGDRSEIRRAFRAPAAHEIFPADARKSPLDGPPPHRRARIRGRFDRPSEFPLALPLR